MTKLKQPLLSLGAHGTVGDALTYQERSKTHFVRRKPIPTDPQSAAQLAHRDAYQRAAASWHDLTGTQKSEWNITARHLRITGFNRYMHYLLKLIDNLSIRWTFMEGAGLLTHDSWGTAPAATLIGPTWLPSKWANALSFDGINDRCSMLTPEDVKFSSEDFSIIARIKPRFQATHRALIGNLIWLTNGFNLLIRNNNALLFYFSTPAGTCNCLSLANTALNDAWQLITFTRSGNNPKLYLNAVDVTSWHDFDKDLVPNVTNTYLGNEPGLTQTFYGLIDFILILRGIELTPAQVQDWVERTL